MRGKIDRTVRFGLLALGLGLLIPSCVYVVREPPRPKVYVDKEHRRHFPSHYYYPGPKFYFRSIPIDWYWSAGRGWRSGQAMPPHNPPEVPETALVHPGSGRLGEPQGPTPMDARDKDVPRDENVQSTQ